MGIHSQPSHRPNSSYSSLGSDFEFGSFSSTSRFDEQLTLEDYFGSERPRENALHPLLSEAQGSNFVPPRRRLGAGSAITATTSPEIRALDLPFTPPFHRLCQGTPPGSEVSLGSVSPKTKNGSISSSPSSSDSSSARISRTSMSTLLSSLDSYGIGRSNEEDFQARHKEPTTIHRTLVDNATSVMGSILNEAVSTTGIQGKLNNAGEGSGLRKGLSSSSSTRRNIPIVLPQAKVKPETIQYDKMNPKADSTNIHWKHSKITKRRGDPCLSSQPESFNFTRNKVIVDRDSFGNSRNGTVKKKEVFPPYCTNSFESPSLAILDNLTGTKKSKRIKGRSVVKPASSSSFKVHNDRSLPQTKSKTALNRNKAQNKGPFPKKMIANNHDSTLSKASNKPLIPLRERNRNISLSTPIEN